ncbi:hypothetical protein [Saccharopolyspora mangrovi]|uniref:DUF3137 domain-containing protein n=1 Tax=Saccharopolyspora mangrovi TaxID=3082379 RepID=A0ABU6AL58_9PSEU|nr:hypothetical protein [Saccharopolyspora sp. S2-29]MEB3372293.1 hypothetical protein [Saccharopolyspora sp. S2-29]
MSIIRNIPKLVREWNPHIDPDFDDYVGGTRRGGARERLVPNFKLFHITSVALLAIFLISLFTLRSISGIVPPMLLIGATEAAIFGSQWFISTYRTSLTRAQFVTPGDWVTCNPAEDSQHRDSQIPFAHLSQVTKRYVHHSKYGDQFYLALRNGKQLSLAESDSVVTFRLHDPFRRARKLSAPGKTWDQVEGSVTYVVSWLWDRRLERKSELRQDELRKAFEFLSDREFREVMSACLSAGLIRYRGFRGDHVELTDAGIVYVAQEHREQGIELIDNDSLEKEPVNLTINGPFLHGTNYGNFAMNNGGVNNMTVTNERDDQAQLIAKLVDILKNSERVDEISKSERDELNDSVSVLSDVKNSNEASKPAARQALRASLRIAKDIVIGASGNAFYESLKALL